VKLFKSRNIGKRNRKVPGKNEPQKQLFRGLIIMGVILMTVVFFFGDHGLYQLMRLKAERQETQETINQLRAERIELDAKKIRLETDLEYVERLAREKYRMARRGEKVFKVISKNSTGKDEN